MISNQPCRSSHPSPLLPFFPLALFYYFLAPSKRWWWEAGGGREGGKAGGGERGRREAGEGGSLRGRDTVTMRPTTQCACLHTYSLQADTFNHLLFFLVERHQLSHAHTLPSSLPLTPLPSRWLQRPLFAVAPIRARQSILSLLRGDPSLLSALQECYGAASLTGTGRGSVFRYVHWLARGRGREGRRAEGRRKGTWQFTHSLCSTIDRSTPDLERTAQRFLSFSSSSPSASRGKLGLRDLLEVYTAALTLGKWREGENRGTTKGMNGGSERGELRSVRTLTFLFLFPFQTHIHFLLQDGSLKRSPPLCRKGHAQPLTRRCGRPWPK